MPAAAPRTALDSAERPEESRHVLAEAEEYAEAFAALGKEVHGQHSAALNAMLALMKANPGLKITMNYRGARSGLSA